MQVDCIELAEPMVKELECLETIGIIAFEAFLSKEVLIVAPVLCFTCDNPRASECQKSPTILDLGLECSVEYAW